jgi:Carboxypeptidase regulatory-like domain
VIPGANAIAINASTQVRTATVTNQDGAFTIPNLLAGTYTVRVETAGFQAFEKSNVLLDPNGFARADCVLSVGSTESTVKVSESAPLLETQQTTLDQTISHGYVENLPNIVSGGIRDITTLLNLAPGLVQGEAAFPPILAVDAPSRRSCFSMAFPIIHNPLIYVALSNRPDQDIISEVQVQVGVPNADFQQKRNYDSPTFLSSW